jgi:hypothetical protein
LHFSNLNLQLTFCYKDNKQDFFKAKRKKERKKEKKKERKKDKECLLYCLLVLLVFKRLRNLFESSSNNQRFVQLFCKKHFVLIIIFEEFQTKAKL